MEQGGLQYTFLLCAYFSHWNLCLITQLSKIQFHFIALSHSVWLCSNILVYLLAYTRIFSRTCSVSVNTWLIHYACLVPDGSLKKILNGFWSNVNGWEKDGRKTKKERNNRVYRWKHNFKKKWKVIMKIRSCFCTCSPC